jgi:hypothetical protein
MPKKPNPRLLMRLRFQKEKRKGLLGTKAQKKKEGKFDHFCSLEHVIIYLTPLLD